jgi:hypothetical protein
MRAAILRPEGGICAGSLTLGRSARNGTAGCDAEERAQ